MVVVSIRIGHNYFMENIFENNRFNGELSYAKPGEDAIANNFKRKLAVGAILGSLLGLGQLAPVIDYEKEFYSRPFGKIIKEHQEGQKDHSLPEPEPLSDYIVEIDSASTMSVDTSSTIKLQSWGHVYRLVQEADNSESSAGKNF